MTNLTHVRASIAVLVLSMFCAWAPHTAAAEHIKIGTIKGIGLGPNFLAADNGYYAAEGLDAEIVLFDTGEPIAVAVASGAIDFGVDGISAGLYNLAGQGALRIIAGSAAEHPGFAAQGYLASNRAYESGLKSVKDFPGHSIGIPVVGSSQHYAISLLAEKYGFDLKSLKLLALQSNANIASALTGGQADAGVLPQAATIQLFQRGAAKSLGWVGDETPWQISVVWIATKTANERRDTVERFLRGYRRGMRAYHDAFIGPDERRQDGPGAPAALAIIAKYTSLTPEQVKLGLGYDDADARLDVKDVLHQIAWFKSQGMVKPEVNGDEIIDKRYVLPLP